jgi:hypothetical protein
MNHTGVRSVGADRQARRKGLFERSGTDGESGAVSLNWTTP